MKQARRIHLWCIYLHLVDVMVNVGKHTVHAFLSRDTPLEGNAKRLAAKSLGAGTSVKKQRQGPGGKSFIFTFVDRNYGLNFIVLAVGCLKSERVFLRK